MSMIEPLNKVELKLVDLLGRKKGKKGQGADWLKYLQDQKTYFQL